MSIMSMDANIDWYYPAMNEMHLRFGEWLADRLYDRGLTQTEFALRIGVDQSTVSGWVTGANPPGRTNCYKIADFFGVPRAEVIRMAGHKPSVRDVQRPVTPTVPPAADTEVLLTDPLPSGHYSRDDIRAIARSVVEEMGGFVSIRILGYVPADTTRWAAWEHEDRSMPFPREMLGSRSPDQFFVLIASGDCLIRRGISDGAYVLVRKLDAGERPQHDRMVVVRLGGDYTLKVWSVEEGRTRLRDGDGNLIAELDNADDVQVIGVVVSATNVF